MGLSAQEQSLVKAISHTGGTLHADLVRHVGLPTGGSNHAALDETRGLFTDRLAALGAQVTLVPGDPKPEWLYGVTPGGRIPVTAICARTHPSARAKVLLCGHLDTVHDPKGSFRSLTVSADGKTATGPGCVDMKGGLVVAVAAIEAIEAAGVPLSWTFILNSDEETGSYHSERALRKAAPGHDVALVYEPAMANGALVTERAGSGQFVIEARGRSAHVGRDFASGVSAVAALAGAITRVTAFAEPERALIANIGPIEGGSATNVVPDAARAWGNVRFADSAGAAELKGKLESLQTPAGAIPGITVRTSFIRAAKPLTPGTNALALAARGAAEDLGQSLPFGKTAGVCDGNIFQDAGVPCIDTLGVRGGGLHTPEEWIELASLVERCQLSAVLLSRLAEGRVELPPPVRR